jgi:tryprostatin B 6-hydroxylase
MLTVGSQIVPFLAGVLSHLAYFNKGEHHLYTITYIQSFLAVLSATALLLISYEGQEFLSAFCQSLKLGASFIAGLCSSLVCYRLLFHPLNRFPGALGARVSSFWLPLKLSSEPGFKQVKKLHDQYGSFVRLGPNYVSLAHPKAVNMVYGGASKCTKAAWYDLTKPMVSLQTFRERSFHDERRRVWSAAFGDKSLRGYEYRLQGYRKKLMDHITSLDGKPVNVTKWFNLYSFDFMGDLAFGKSFDMLENQEHWAIKLLNDAIEPLSFGFPVWFFRLLTAAPMLTRDWWRFIDFCAEQIERRLKVIPLCIKLLQTYAKLK